MSAVLADEIEGPPALGIGSVLNKEGTTWYHSDQAVSNIDDTYIWMFGCNQAATALASAIAALNLADDRVIGLSAVISGPPAASGIVSNLRQNPQGA